MNRKDTTKPKRGLSAYMFFCSDKRADVNKEFPDLTFGDVGKKLGEMWKSLSSEMRAPYEEKAKADKQRYLQEMTQLKGSVEKAKPKTGKIIKKKKDGK